MRNAEATRERLVQAARRIFSERGYERTTVRDIAALGLHESRAFQHEEDLLEVGLGESGSRGDVAHGGRTCVVFVQGK